MTLLEKIRADQLQARKEKNTIKASLLTTLVSEAAAVGKNDGNRETTDPEVVSLIQKFIKNIEFTISKINSAGSESVPKIELDILSDYLPKQMTDQDILDQINIIKQRVSNDKALKGAVMKHFKENFTGQYDSQKVIALI